MQVIRSLEQTPSSPVGYGIRVLLCSTEGQAGPLARKLASLGGQVDLFDEVFTSLSEVIADPMGYALLVIDCDSASIGGLEAGQRAVMMLGETASRVPVILVSQDCSQQHFPEDRLSPTQLRAPLSSVSLRVGIEHALRERLAYCT